MAFLGSAGLSPGSLSEAVVWSAAADCEGEGLGPHPEDHTAGFFVDKATRYIKNGVPANWAGVEEMMNK